MRRPGTCRISRILLPLLLIAVGGGGVAAQFVADPFENGSSWFISPSGGGVLPPATAADPVMCRNSISLARHHGLTDPSATPWVTLRHAETNRGAEPHTEGRS